MASMSKPALWCVIFLMLSLTVLVYISPSKPSLKSVLQIQQDHSTRHERPVESNTKQDPGGSQVNVVSSSVEATLNSAQLGAAVALHSSSIESATEADFMRSQADIQRRRRAVVNSVCKKFHPNSLEDVVKKPPWNVIVDDKYKLVYCFVQKVACTNWKKVFLVLSGQYNRTDSIPQFFTNRKGAKQLKSLQDYPEEDRRRILRDYTKFMFARHPFSRVLSAYRNKLAPDSTFQRASKWQRKVGQKIINRFRSNLEDAASHGFNKSSYDLSFGEFVKFVLSSGGTKSGNKHWRDLHISCLPCKMQYDVIGKIETIEEDARYILTLSGAKKAVSFPSAEGSSPTNSSDPYLIKKYFADLPSQDVKDLYNRYMIDFLMFDYHGMVEGVLDVR